MNAAVQSRSLIGCLVVCLLGMAAIVIVGTDPDLIRSAFINAVGADRREARRPEKWDGRAAERIVDDIAAWLGAA